jgi:hypothetical protein
VARVFLFIVFAVLLADASGATSLIAPEECTTAFNDTLPDGNCPALCVRCVCCAQIVVPADMQPSIAIDRAVTPLRQARLVVLPSGVPHDILHVPK